MMVCNRNLLFQGSIFRLLVQGGYIRCPFAHEPDTWWVCTVHRWTYTIYIHVGCLMVAKGPPLTCLKERKEAFQNLPITFHTAEIHDDDARFRRWFFSFFFQTGSSTWGACWWTFPKILYTGKCVKWWNMNKTPTTHPDFLWFFLPLTNLAFSIRV